MALLFNRKNKEDKKGKENNIGKIIYCFLLFAPLFSILTTSLYVVFNKNAKDSYYGETINEQNNEYVQINDLNVNEHYYCQTKLTESFNGHLFMNVTNMNLTYNGTDYTNITSQLRFTNNSNNGRPYLQIVSLERFIYLDENTINFDFIYNDAIEKTGTTTYENWFYKVIYNKYSFLDNSWEYGIYKTEESNIYNWAKNTGTYTVLHNTTTLLGITNTFTPMLMAYWLLISVIYFIFDIALILIWAVHKKIHLLVESI